MGQDGLFFDSDDLPMKEPRDWGTLIALVNEDYADLVARNRPQPVDPALWMLDRYDDARAAVGVPPAFSALPAAVRAALADRVRKECSELLHGKNAGIPDDQDGTTLVIEFARGGPDGATMPLTPPYGYQHALSLLAPALLERASILYIWVEPAESRRKNIERANPVKQAAGNTHLSLHHGVPMAVMMGEYGCDDIAYLMSISDRPDTVAVTAHGRAWRLPIARFDNRVDRTTFVRDPQATWPADKVAALHDGLAGAFALLSEAQRHRA